MNDMTDKQDTSTLSPVALATEPDVDSDGNCTFCTAERACCSCTRCEFCSCVAEAPNWVVCETCMATFQRYWDAEKAAIAADPTLAQAHAKIAELWALYHETSAIADVFEHVRIPELEAERDGIASERDAALARVAELEADQAVNTASARSVTARWANARIAELEAQLARCAPSGTPEARQPDVPAILQELDALADRWRATHPVACDTCDDDGFVVDAQGETVPCWACS